MTDGDWWFVRHYGWSDHDSASFLASSHFLPYLPLHCLTSSYLSALSVTYLVTFLLLSQKRLTLQPISALLRTATDLAQFLQNTICGQNYWQPCIFFWNSPHIDHRFHDIAEPFWLWSYYILLNQKIKRNHTKEIPDILQPKCKHFSCSTLLKAHYSATACCGSLRLQWCPLFSALFNIVTGFQWELHLDSFIYTFEHSSV